MFSRRHKGPDPANYGTETLKWKPVFVGALKATEAALEGSPIPAAKTCISLVLKVIEAADMAADNEKVFQELHARYQDLKDFLPSVTSDIPSTVKEVVDDLDLKLKNLAKRWEPRLTRKPKKRDTVLKLFTASDDHTALLGFVTETDQAIKDFLLHFEVKSWIITYREIVKNRQIAILASMPRAQYASYKTLRPGGARTCLEGTRLSVLKTVETWALDPNRDHPPVFWLNGIAGIGKSTIAHSVASRLDSRTINLKNGNLVFPTLAFQLSSFDPLIKSRLAQVLEEDPGCVTDSPKIQFEKLIRQPLAAISISKPLILVFDALDECQADSLEEILWVIVNSIKDIPFLRVFITSRPEGLIREGLAVEDGHSARQKLVLHEDMRVQEEVEKDIRLYLKTSLQEIWQKENQGEWPPEKDLEALVGHSGKLFIYAATMVRFIGGNRTLDLERQLGVLLNVKVGHIPVSSSYRRLDQLYLNILEVALPAEVPDDPHYIERFQNVVGAIVLLQKTLPLDALAPFLGGGYNVSKIRQTLYHLHSIFTVPDDPSNVVRTYHLSFPNFITSADRCTNDNAYINPQKQELYLFLRCLDIMKQFFVPYMRRLDIRQDTIDSFDNQTNVEDVDQPLTNSASNNPVDDDLFEGYTSMNPEVRYAANHWDTHLIAIRTKTASAEQRKEREKEIQISAEALEQLIGALDQFIAHYLPPWLDRRIKQIQPSYGARKMKLAQDTLAVMYNVHRWLAANIDPRESQVMKQTLQTDAHDAFARLFPRAPLDYNYTLGSRSINGFFFVGARLCFLT
ncbi:hypothetical protein D9619_011792 [Psilocybe cf. subviscida]|uniref:NACHT domain-containing protein n=1 Tax=Psilocybe cf. subviscida TaxID=2480587 RepID=A0A8H5EWB9_9AGAR|nr:hypothetical protein D9619_011792 [Psilocybe cf. subviscida]